RTDAEPIGMASLGWDGIAAIVILVLAAFAPEDFLSESGIARLAVRALWLPLYVAVGARLLQRFGVDGVKAFVRQQPALCALLALSVISSTWSLAPLFTLKRSVSLTATTML